MSLSISKHLTTLNISDSDDDESISCDIYTNNNKLETERQTDWLNSSPVKFINEFLNNTDSSDCMDSILLTDNHERTNISKDDTELLQNKEKSIFDFLESDSSDDDSSDDELIPLYEKYELFLDIII
jgi:hypothetical protein